MKKNLKKMLVIVMSLLMVFAMVSCGGDEEEGATLKIGGIGPITGAAAVYGNAVMNGAQLAVDEINADKNNTVKIEFKFEDDAHDAETSVNAYHKLQDWGMQVLMGTVTTSPCIAVSQEAYVDRVFTLTPSASSPKVTEGKDNVFQLCFTDPNQGKTAADYIKETGLGKKVGIIYNNSDAYSTGIVAGFKEEADKIGLSIVANVAYPSDDTTTDFTAQIKACQSAGADIVFLPIYYTPASLILNQANKLGYDPVFFGVDGMDGILALEGFDTSLADGVYLITPFNGWTTGKEFAEKYEEKFGEAPNQFAADAYDCIYAIYQAFTEKECTTDMSASEICEILSAYFKDGFSFDGLTGTNLTWPTNGEVTKAPMFCVIQDGAYVDLK